MAGLEQEEVWTSPLPSWCSAPILRGLRGAGRALPPAGHHGAEARAARCSAVPRGAISRGAQPGCLGPWEPAGWVLCSWRWAGSGWAVVARPGCPGWCDSSVAVLGTRAGPPEPLPWPGQELGMSPDFGEKRDSRFLLPTRGAENRSAPALRGEQAGPGPQPRVPAAAPCVGLCGVGWAAVRGCGGHGAARPSSRPTGAARPQALRCRLSLISIPAV